MLKIKGYIRRKWAESEFLLKSASEEIDSILYNNLPFYSSLNPLQKNEFRRKVIVFLNCKKFIGMNNFRINLYHKVIISALAVRLVLKIGLRYYDHFNTICLFETEFVTNENVKLDGITQSTGIIGISWSSVMEGINNPFDGKNVVFHEFAHALDLYDNNFDGIPRIFGANVIEPLISGILCEHEKFLGEWKEWHRFIYKYEVKDIAEFFAKLTELYFENPDVLKKHNHRLYGILLTIYRYEPTPINNINNSSQVF
jgi:MtfA peptidase